MDVLEQSSKYQPWKLTFQSILWVLASLVGSVIGAWIAGTIIKTTSHALGLGSEIKNPDLLLLGVVGGILGTSGVLVFAARDEISRSKTGPENMLSMLNPLPSIPKLVSIITFVAAYPVIFLWASAHFNTTLALTIKNFPTPSWLDLLIWFPVYVFVGPIAEELFFAVGCGVASDSIGAFGKPCWLPVSYSLSLMLWGGGLTR